MQEAEGIGHGPRRHDLFQRQGLAKNRHRVARRMLTGLDRNTAESIGPDAVLLHVVHAGAAKELRGTRGGRLVALMGGHGLGKPRHRRWAVVVGTL